jgi:hypothetical protein
MYSLANYTRINELTCRYHLDDHLIDE